jgi:hypothetical protein
LGKGDAAAASKPRQRPDVENGTRGGIGTHPFFLSSLRNVS